MFLFDRVLQKIEEVILASAVLGMAIVLIGGVISRSVFNSSWSFTEEVAQALNIIVTFMGIGYCARQARHISMSAIFDLVGDKVKKIFMLIITLFTAAILFYIAYLGVQYAISVHDLGRVSATLRIPMWIIVSPLAIGFFFGGLEYFRTFLINLMKPKEIRISSYLKLGESYESLSDKRMLAEAHKAEAEAASVETKGDDV